MAALQPLWQSGAVTLWIPETLYQSHPPNLPVSTIQTYTGSLAEQLAPLWTTHRSLVFCLATGAVARLIAPFLQDKATDPAVVVADATGRYVISLSGGHQGGADALTRSIARQLGATPILTGGANGLNLPAIDTLGTPFGWQRGTGNWTGVSAAMAQGRSVQVIQEAGSTLWQKGLPEEHPFVVEVGVQAEENRKGMFSTPHAPL
ncbi:precorrin-3B C(17)-methyltransferase, partial [filamentous cyanobacterium CCP1]